MWILLVFSLIVGTNGSPVDVTEDYAAIHQRMEAQRNRLLNSEISQVLRYNALCSKTDWACNRSCRLQFPNGTQRCRRPAEEDLCFGQPILYNYTADQDDVFPDFLSILQNFPRCWEKLNPLVCAVFYRPCSTRKYTEAGLGGVRKIELWQVFQYALCSNAQEECGFLVEQGIWPDALQCEDTVELRRGETFESALRERRLLFNDDGQCKFRYTNNMLVHSTRCLPPLVSIRTDTPLSAVRPLIDECYVPCSSSFVRSDDRLRSFRRWLLGICGLLGGCFLFALVYIHLRSHLFSKGFICFILSNIFFSMAAFFVIWFFSLLNSITSDGSAACVGEISGIFVRRELKFGNFNLCTIQSLALSTLMIAAYGWLPVFFLFVCFRPKLRADHNYECDVKSNFVNIRPLTTCLIYALALICSLGGLWTQPDFADGLTGVCSNLLGPFRSAFFVHIPVLLVCFISAVVVVLKVSKDEEEETPVFHTRSKRSSHLNVQQSEPLMEANGDFRPSSIRSFSSLSSCPLDVSYFAITRPWVVSILLCALVCPILAFSIHILFNLDANSEVVALKQVIKCTLDIVQRQNKQSKTAIVKNDAIDIPSACPVAEASNVDFFLMTFYVLLLPSTPFVFLVVGLLLGSKWKNCGFRRLDTFSVFGRANDIDQTRRRSENLMEMDDLTRPEESVAPSQIEESEVEANSREYEGENSMTSEVQTPRPSIRKPSRPVRKQLKKRQTSLDRSQDPDIRRINLPNRLVNHRREGREHFKRMQSSSSSRTVSRPSSVPVNYAPAEYSIFPSLEQVNPQLLQMLSIDPQQEVRLTLSQYWNLVFAATLPHSSAAPQPAEPATTEMLSSSESNEPEEENAEPDEDSDDFNSDVEDEEEERAFNERFGGQKKTNEEGESRVSNSDDNAGTTQPSIALSFITKYAQENDARPNRLIFVQRALLHFRRLFERDEVFRSWCPRRSRADLCDPELNTLDEGHTITLSNVLKLTARIPNQEMCQRVEALCGEAINLTLEDVRAGTMRMPESSQSTCTCYRPPPQCAVHSPPAAQWNQCPPTTIPNGGHPRRPMALRPPPFRSNSEENPPFL